MTTMTMTSPWDEVSVCSMFSTNKYADLNKQSASENGNGRKGFCKDKFHQSFCDIFTSSISNKNQFKEEDPILIFIKKWIVALNLAAQSNDGSRPYI